MITVWTKPGHCSQCDATKRILDKKGIDYRERVIGDVEREAFKAQGLMQAPIVETDRETWAGHRMDKLITL